MVDALYDLRDDEKIKPDDNIVIHFSGHGSSYDARDYRDFTTFASKAGSIEAICPVDRGGSIPDISERELNSILSELRAAKGPNITIILDCCHAGGAVRSFSGSDTNAIRFIPPIRSNDALDLMRMFEAADSNPRRGPNEPNVPNIFSELWMPDISSFVLLAACQDFQYAEESNFVDFYNTDSGTRGMMTVPTTGRSPRQGRFTFALIKILESEMARKATYESVITSIGRLGRLQVPLAVGSRKHARLWFEE